MNPSNRSGAMLVMVAFVLIIFLVIAAFCVDIAYMHMVRAEMRTAVDAASKAGSEALAREQDEGLAIAAALEFSERNVVAGNGLTLNRDDVQIGTATLGNSGRFDFETGGRNPN